MDKKGKKLPSVTIKDMAGNTINTADVSNDGNPIVMQPKLGSALLFFPAFADGRPDDRTLHKSEVMTSSSSNDDDDEKWIIQMWIHERTYQAILPPGNTHDAAHTALVQALKDLNYS